MSDKNDYGFYGKGLDGYVHYKQSFDRIKNEEQYNKPQKKNTVQTNQESKEETNEDVPLIENIKTLAWVIGMLALTFGVPMLIYQIIVGDFP